jgi:hypothetical protein
VENPAEETTVTRIKIHYGLRQCFREHHAPHEIGRITKVFSSEFSAVIASASLPSLHALQQSANLPTTGGDIRPPVSAGGVVTRSREAEATEVTQGVSNEETILHPNRNSSILHAARFSGRLSSTVSGNRVVIHKHRDCAAKHFESSRWCPSRQGSAQSRPSAIPPGQAVANVRLVFSTPANGVRIFRGPRLRYSGRLA